jgi:CHAT domain-containing protein
VQERRRVETERAAAAETARLAYTRARVDAESRWTEVRQTIQSALPAPITAGEARTALPPDTILLAFAVGTDASTLFVVTRDGPARVFPLAVPLTELAARVDFVRRSVSRERSDRGIKVPGTDEVRVSAARDLYQKLFPPEAREAILKAARILISADDVLWDLPFAALVVNDQGKAQYLGLEKPLVYTQSLTTFAQTQKGSARPGGAKPNVLVVGNPLFDNALRPGSVAGARRPPATAVTGRPGGKRAPGELTLLSRDGAIPEPLPFAETEANDVAKLYGAHAATGVLPTEAWFRQHAGDADVIHLATHGYFNPFRAASSGVRLAVPEGEPPPGETDNDGALQVWEVFNLQLRADLIVLSACETGLGSKVPGEGLVGLTRAFQVAGAASVVATEWRVSDRSTATGMVAFHQQLRKGLPKDEALRLAMRRVAGDPATADPYYWAPFVLFGDFHPLRSITPR